MKKLKIKKETGYLRGILNIKYKGHFQNKPSSALFLLWLLQPSSL